MIYSPRLRKILSYCLQQDEYVSVETLAKICKTSTRTIFRELKDLDVMLQEYELTFTSKTKAGLKFEGAKDQKALLLKDLSVQEVAYLDKEERQTMLIFELLHSDDLEKLVHYATMFQVSEATISNDLDAITPWFETFHLSLIRRPGIGVKLEGKEQDVRQAITSIIAQSVQTNEQLQSINFLDSSSLLHQIFLDTGSQSILKLLDQEILTRILHVFETYQHDLSLDRYASVGYIGLIIHLVIAIDRILKQEELQDNQEVLDMVSMDPAYRQAKKMAHYLELEFDIDIPDVETAFIALHIKGAKITRNNQVQTMKLRQLIEQMLARYQPSLRAILLNDEELMNGLLTHMEPTITRLKHHLPIYNPLRESIQTMYADLYAQTKQACQVIEEAYDCVVNEDEVAFLTMHVGASLERGKQEQRYHRTIACGVVCASGVGVSALLSARITKAIPEGIAVTTLSMEDILEHRYQDYELLISTFALDVSDKTLIQVSPLLNEEDVITLSLTLERLWKKQEPNATQAHEDLLYQLYEVSACAIHLYESVRFYTIPSTYDVNDMISYGASLFEHPEEIITALQHREALGSTKMDDFGFLLLHAKIKHFKQPELFLLYPEKRKFDQEPNIKFVLVLLLAEHMPAINQRLCSRIIRALVEDDEFLTSLQQRKETQIKEHLKLLEESFLKAMIQGE